MKKIKLKNDILFYTIILFCYIIFSMLILNSNLLQTYLETFSASKSYFPTIIIDAGHGGIDSGAVGTDGTLEKDINLNIALKLKDLFNISGFNVIMTREIDESIHDENSKTIRAKKVSDLKNRLNIINKNQNNLLISIHQNKFENKKYKGSQIFYSKNNPLSKELAQSMKSSFLEFIQKDNNREIKPSPEGVFLLNKSNVPAIIVECGFLSNDEDTKNLKNNEYQTKIAFSIFCGFLDFWRKS